MAATAAGLFYERLFALDPGLRPMFAHTDMERQGKKLIQALGVVVGTADRLHTLAPTLEQLGRAHVAYGVADRHYDTVGAALLATLESALGDAFTAPLREAWAEAYTSVAALTLAGARQGQQAA
jgi:hemoglobin-like flavoprotein